MEVSNKDGIGLIDNASKQIKTGKSGNVVPGSFIQYSVSLAPFVQTPYAPAVILPRPRGKSFIFIKVRRTTGSATSFFPFSVCLMYGECDVTITKKAGGASGSNNFFADLTYGTPLFNFGAATSILNTGKISGLSGNSHLDPGIGEALPGGSAYVSGSSNPTITNCESDGTYDTKITLGQNLTSTIPNNTSFTMTKDIVVFTRTYNSAWDSGWVLDYKFGEENDKEDETGDYGLQLFAPNGDLSFSSNRENFLIDSLVSGDPDLPIDGSGTPFGEADPVLPIVAAEVGNLSNYDDYWVMATSCGYCTQLLTGGVSNPRARSWGAGYIFSPPNNGDYANSTLTNNPFATPNTLSKTSSSANGIAMAPINTSQYHSGPQISGGGYVSDAMAYDATRTLIIGHFV